MPMALLFALTCSNKHHRAEDILRCCRSLYPISVHMSLEVSSDKISLRIPRSHTRGREVCTPPAVLAVRSLFFTVQTASAMSNVAPQHLAIRDPGKADKKTNPNALDLTDQTNLLPFRKIVPVFLGLALCMVVSTLDSVIVATALPTISSAFNAGSVVSWVPSAYLLTSTSFQPLYGRFSDIFGRKAALCMGMIVFMIGSLAAGFSRSIIELIVFRGFAGAGGGGIISMAQIVMSDVVSLRDRYVTDLCKKI